MLSESQELRHGHEPREPKIDRVPTPRNDADPSRPAWSYDEIGLVLAAERRIGLKVETRAKREGGGP